LPVNRPTAFDAYLAVDWSANSTPKTGTDSIWIAWGKWDQGDLFVGELANPSTRGEASALVGGLLKELVAGGARVLAGFDFAYGYPRGLSKALSLDDRSPGWLAVWNELGRLIEDRPDNANNRFEVASTLNGLLGPPGPFWACPAPAETPALLARKSEYPHQTPSGLALAEYRAVDRHLRGTGRLVHSPWKLFTAGSVGSQTLLGIHHLVRLVRGASLRERSWVWPFETGFRLPDEAVRPGVVHVEIWPGLFELDLTRHHTKDAAQVLSVVHEFVRRDAVGSLASLFGPAAVPPACLSACQNEEGWIFGA
jgi:hypothetical protein